MGVPFTPDLLEYTPLPAAMVDKWQQAIQQKQQQPGPPPPQVISAMANMKRADAAAMKVQVDAQKNAAQTQQTQQQMRQDAFMAPLEMQARMAEVENDRQEQMIRRLEAVAQLLTAQASARTAAIDSLGLTPDGMAY